MPKYIDVDKTLRNLPDDIPYKASVKRVLMQAPEADVVEVKHGKWHKNGNEKKCSVCGFIYYSNNDEWNHCPNCGAKMAGGTSDGQDNAD